MAVLVDLAVMHRVLRIRYKGAVGSAVYVELDGVKQIFTANHLVRGMMPGDRMEIRFNEGWHFIDVRDVEHCEAGTDVSAICPVTHWGEGLGEDQLTGGVHIGQEVAFCGFPLNSEMNGMPGTLGWPICFVKWGAFSGALKRSDDTYEYLFDAINNRGFSGGPIIIKEQGKLKVIAIVSEYKYDSPSPVYRKKPDDVEEVETEWYVKPNSGFMVGVPIKRAVDCGRKIVSRYHR